MRNRTHILTYAVVLIAIVLIGGIAWWYFFLHAKTQTIAAADAGRGDSTSAPSFSNPVGSTYQNVVSSIAAPRENAAGTEQGTSTAKKLSRLTQVSTAPVAGMGFVGAGASATLRFVERSSGNVLEMSLESGELARLTNTLIPRVYEAAVARTGVVIERGLDDTGGITTFVGIVATSSTATSTVGTLSQRPLARNISAIRFSPSGKELFYLLPNQSGKALGIRSVWDGTKPKQVFSSGITGWQPQWLADGRIILVQNASDGADGYAYELGKNGALSLLASKEPGLTVLPRASSTAAIFGESSGSAQILFGQVSAQATRIPLPVKTIADKCLWSIGKELVALCAVPQQSLGAHFLDAWHRGEVHTSDSWWTVNVSAGSAQVLYSSESASLDVENPIIDDSGAYIAFMNGRDQSLWLLRTSEQ